MPYTAPTVDADIFKPQTTAYDNFLANAAQQNTARGILSGAALRNRTANNTGDPNGYSDLVKAQMANQLAGSNQEIGGEVDKAYLGNFAAITNAGGGVTPRNSQFLSLNQGQIDEASAIGANARQSEASENYANSVSLLAGAGYGTPPAAIGPMIAGPGDETPPVITPDYLPPAARNDARLNEIRDYQAKTDRIDVNNPAKYARGGGSDDNSGTENKPYRMMEYGATRELFAVYRSKTPGQPDTWISSRTGQRLPPPKTEIGWIARN